MRKSYVFKLLSILLTVVILFGVGAIPTSVKGYGYVTEESLGDVNLDHTVNIKDATHIQKYHAGLVELTNIQKAVSDANEDGEYNVKDATFLQKSLAGLEKAIKGGVYAEIGVLGFYGNFDSGKAMAGVPVTFTARAFARPKPCTIQVKVDGEVVETLADTLSWTYVFSQPGDYSMEVTASNILGDTWSESMTYKVVEPYEIDELEIIGLTFDTFHPDDLRAITAYTFVQGGTAPYEYRFEITGEEKSGNEILPIVRDFTAESSFTFGEGENDIYIRMGEYTMNVIVRDSKGIVASQNYDFTVESGAVG